MKDQKNYPGTLISIEGIDGSGKSTVAQGLHRELTAHGFSTMLTKEPGGTPLGMALRELLQHRTAPLCSRAEYLLFAADRAQHMEYLIKHALEKATIVISDRMADSSVAYQGYGRGMDIDMIKAINRWAMEERTPNLVLFIRVDVPTAIERTRARREKLTAFEQEDYSFMERVAHGFETIFKHQNNVIIINGMQSPEKVIEDAVAAVTTWLSEHR